MLLRHRQTGGFGRKIDGDDGGNVGDRKLIAGHERHIGEPGIEVGVEIPHAQPAALDQRRNLFVSCGPAMARFLRPGTELRAASIADANPSISARRSHIATSALVFGVTPSSRGSGWTSSR